MEVDSRCEGKGQGQGGEGCEGEWRKKTEEKSQGERQG